MYLSLFTNRPWTWFLELQPFLFTPLSRDLKGTDSACLEGGA